MQTKPKIQTLRNIALACVALIVAICLWCARYQIQDSVATVGPTEEVIQFRPVKMVSSAHSDIFPKEWFSREIKAKAKPLVKTEIERTRRVLNEAIKKYPQRLLDNELQTVYALSALSYRGISACGIYSDKDIYIVNAGEDKGYDDAWIEATFHHEFSSLLLWRYPQYLETNAWNAVNPDSFKYGEDGVQAIKQQRDSQECDQSLCSIGFWCEYSQNSIEEDFNIVAERLFLGDPTLHGMAAKYPKIKRKQKLVISFYEKLDPTFNEAFFVSLVDDRKQKD